MPRVATSNQCAGDSASEGGATAQHISLHDTFAIPATTHREKTMLLQWLLALLALLLLVDAKPSCTTEGMSRFFEDLPFLSVLILFFHLRLLGTVALEKLCRRSSFIEMLDRFLVSAYVPTLQSELIGFRRLLNGGSIIHVSARNAWLLFIITMPTLC